MTRLRKERQDKNKMKLLADKVDEPDPVLVKIVFYFKSEGARKRFYDAIAGRGWFRSTLKSGGVKMLLRHTDMVYSKGCSIVMSGVPGK